MLYVIILILIHSLNQTTNQTTNQPIIPHSTTATMVRFQELGKTHSTYPQILNCLVTMIRWMWSRLGLCFTSICHWICLCQIVFLFFSSFGLTCNKQQNSIHQTCAQTNSTRQLETGSIVAVKILGVLALLDDGETDWSVVPF